MKEYWLIPWSDTPPYGNGRIIIQVTADRYDVRLDQEWMPKQSIRGRYIWYPEGIFGVFVDEAEQVCLMMKGKIVVLSDVLSIHWYASFYRRELTLNLANGQALHFEYLSIWRLLISPRIILDQLLLDMWELTFELPNWVYEHYQNGGEGVDFMRKVCLEEA